MNFMQWLNSLDDLLYEIVSWIVFFPITLWKIIRHPLAMMAYAEAQLSDPAEEQYTQTLSPPVFLVLALVIAHAMELALGKGVNPIVRSQHGLAGLVNDDTSLLFLRLILFSVFPLIMATRLVSQQPVPFDRQTLQRPFYAQCFAAAPFALAISLGGTLAQMQVPSVRIAGLVTAALAFLLYGSMQTLWFARQLGRSYFRGFLDASIALVASLVVALIAATLFVL